MGKRCEAQLTLVQTSEMQDKLAISQREQPSVYDEVINVIVNVIVKKKYMHVPRVVHACNFWGTRL